MLELTPDTAAEYLRRAGRVGVDEVVEVSELAGGVSNVVLRVMRPQCEAFILKQARSKLRVADDWFCSIERIWREAEVLRICERLLALSPPETPAASIVYAARPSVPQLLWEDRDNYCFAMSAAPLASKTWKQLLLAGELPISRGVAQACGQMLGTLHAQSWGSADIAAACDDRSFFDALRVDPYYRQIARVHADLCGTVDELIDCVWQNRLALVHGDFSPKNLLVSQREVMLIDFEVGHYGDPAFDLGFFLTHLVLKALWSGPRRAEYRLLATMFWRSYCSILASRASAAELTSLEARTALNLAGCLLARVDGKSPVDYLSLEQQNRVRTLAREMFARRPSTWEETEQRIMQFLDRNPGGGQ